MSKDDSPYNLDGPRLPLPPGYEEHDEAFQLARARASEMLREIGESRAALAGIGATVGSPPPLALVKEIVRVVRWLQAFEARQLTLIASGSLSLAELNFETSLSADKVQHLAAYELGQQGKRHENWIRISIAVLSAVLGAAFKWLFEPPGH